MIYGSVCSGIEAATVAWEPLGWKAAWFSEIEPFPCEVLAHHYPKTENLGDMTKLYEKELFNDRPIDLLVGGTPCQSFSIAGLRKGLADPRGNLALHFLKILDAKRPRWVVWENVPGVLSSWSDEEGSSGGRRWQRNDFDTFIAGLKELGYGIAWRILDAQYFGVPQRRRRVFVIGYLGDRRAAAAVLFESHSLSWYPPPSRETGQGASADVAPGLTASGRGVERTGESRGQDPVIAHTLRGRGFDASEDGCGRGTPLVPIAFIGGQGSDAGSIGAEEEVSPTVKGSGGGNATPSVALPINTQIATRSKKLGRGTGFGVGEDGDPAFTLQSAHSHAVASEMVVRRLTPRECERLQGFPDNYTLIKRANGKMAVDGPRYKALGNSMAVPVMLWIGKRIEQVELELLAA